MTTDRLAVEVGGLRLANPVICGAGEHLIDPAGVRAAIAAGAGAVVVKSANESEAARRQLAHTDYALLDSSWRRLPWDFDPPPDASLLNRSGLFPGSFDEWLSMIAGLMAEPGSSVIIPSIIPADYDRAVELCHRTVDATGCVAIELNTGAPHGREATAGAIALETGPDRLRDLVTAVRRSVPVPLWVKLTGQTDDVVELAVAARAGGADAVTLTGRFMAMLPDVDTQAPVLGTVGAFGGPWALPLTCRWLALTRERLGPDVSLVATNGVRTGLDVARCLLAGARAVQMTSAVFAGGFGTITATLADLDRYLGEHGDTAQGIVGRAADRLGRYGDQPADPDRWRRFVPLGPVRPAPSRVAGEERAMVDITVFTGERSRQGYRINKLSSSLTDPANREAFLADEDAYCRRFGLTDHERQLVADRDWTGIVAAGGNIYLFIKIAATIGSNLVEVGARMRGESVEEFLAGRPLNQDR